MVAGTMKRYLNINDAHFFISINFKSSYFWMLFSQAHTLCTMLDCSSFILTSFQALIPQHFQVCHST